MQMRDGAHSSSLNRAWRTTIETRSVTGRRPANQDRCFAWSAPKVARVLVGVADGMGGYSGGEIASRILFERLDGLADDIVGVVDAGACRSLLAQPYRQACEELKIFAQSDPKLSDMGSTLACVALVDGRFVAANVGDSRIYWLHDGQLIQVTKDHTALQEALDRGAATDEPGIVAELSRALTRHVGAGGQVRVDVFPTPAGSYETRSSDVLLLCSDGLHGSVSDESIQFVLENASSPKVAADYLINLALSNGSTDNITVVVVGVGTWHCHGKRLPKCALASGSVITRLKRRGALIVALVLSICGLVGWLIGTSLHMAVHGTATPQVGVKRSERLAEPGALRASHRRVKIGTRHIPIAGSELNDSTLSAVVRRSPSAGAVRRDANQRHRPARVNSYTSSQPDTDPRKVN